jgi:hypothetical protein
MALGYYFDSYSGAQRQLIFQGQLIANDDVEGIHVLNRDSCQIYDISE